MKLKIRSLHMENFKGIKSLDVNFSNKTISLLLRKMESFGNVVV